MKINSILFLLIVMVTVFSCNKKDDFNYPKGTVGISKITYFALLTLKGDTYMSVVKGQTFTDPGATATVNGASAPVTTSGTVDINTVGLYIITYSAVNADGYAATTTRTVFVLPAAETPGVDLSGTYAAVPVGSTPGPATISKVAPGAYLTTNCWGNSGAVIPAFFICVDGSSIIVPTQGSPYGNLETTAPGTYVSGLITWSIDLLGQGPYIAVKQWQKQ